MTSTPRRLHHRDREVGGRAAEHVGEDHDAVAGVGGIDAGEDVAAALFHVVVRTDGHGLDLLLWSDDVLECRFELNGERAVRHQNKADHTLSSRDQHALTGKPAESCPMGSIIQAVFVSPGAERRKGFADQQNLMLEPDDAGLRHRAAGHGNPKQLRRKCGLLRHPLEAFDEVDDEADAPRSAT